MKYKLNPNEKVVNAIKKRLEVTKGYCPCMTPEDWEKHGEDALCPCKPMREKHECHCTLYIGVEED